MFSRDEKYGVLLPLTGLRHHALATLMRRWKVSIAALFAVHNTVLVPEKWVLWECAWRVRCSSYSMRSYHSWSNPQWSDTLTASTARMSGWVWRRTSSVGLGTSNEWLIKEWQKRSMKEKWVVRELGGDLGWPSKTKYQRYWSLKKHMDFSEGIYKKVDDSERGERGI